MEIAVAQPCRKDLSPRWWLPVLLAIPALIPLAQSIILARLRGEVATGFIQGDMPCYMANARQHFAQGFHLFYGNPYAGYDTPTVYFQPHIFLLGSLLQLGLDPGVTYDIFGLAAMFFAAFVAVRFYREVVGWDSLAAKLGLICFFWGGGILSLAGLVYACLVGKFNSTTVLHFDTTRGWWMLNFGRNLVYATEAYYHGVFLLCMLFLIRRRLNGAIALAALLSLSHPFTGLEAVLIVAAYLVMERFYGDKSVKPAHLVSSAVLVVFHVGYYLIFLNRFADHRSVVRQWEVAGVAWLYQSSTFLPALLLVGLLALARLTRWPGFRQVIKEPRNRLFLVWFLIVFGLTQHYRIMKAVQPIHFAHGYDWMALFFLGSPVLVLLLKRLLKIEPAALRTLAVSAFLIFFLSDNIAWFGTFLSPNSLSAFSVTRDQKDVLDWLSQSAVPPDMVVSQDLRVGYLTSTYTRVRSWSGHGLNTPSTDQRMREVRQAFQEGTILPAWQSMHVLYVSYHNAGWKPPANSRAVFHNAGYDVWECPPAGDGRSFHGRH